MGERLGTDPGKSIDDLFPDATRITGRDQLPDGAECERTCWDPRENRFVDVYATTDPNTYELKHFVVVGDYDL